MDRRLRTFLCPRSRQIATESPPERDEQLQKSEHRPLTSLHAEEGGAIGEDASSLCEIWHEDESS